ncbi:hypothetical protein SAMN02746041_00861 [Desulfacinum hydrothermale DSM 13146]|uniref:Uncharacterized protein n=1 Tax=Desulfacinum hydrothermale DSM 13146 TaxID=1121390 RepID=A0A1W1X9E6_9BACT|nr:hypothetical protein [Desulfacinum hydrothermale]SMC20278.1 hypothetical protein SAMN02746041_00861 [Desulfacinum hydrothermale DSM 13146]
MHEEPQRAVATAAPQTIPNPVKCKEGKGLRNFDCLFYDDCLDKAAKAMWSGFTCGKCAYYEE